MNWKLPEVLQRSVEYFKPNRGALQRPHSPILQESEDDLGIGRVQHKGTVPFRRVESAVHKFIDVALPADLGRLHQHRCNIKKWRSLRDFNKLSEEYTNAARTVQQLTRNIKEAENLRARVVEDDLVVFDKHLTPARKKALDEIQEFLSIHGERPSQNATIEKAQPLDVRNNAKVYEYASRDLETGSFGGNEHCEIQHPFSYGSNTGFAQLRGNQIVIGNFRSDEESTMDAEREDVADNRSAVAKFQHFQTQCDKETLETDECWEKLQKDIAELHEIMKDFSMIVNEQGRAVDDISSNVETAEENIKEGKSQLQKASVFKAAMLPVIGAIVGGVVGGPIGMVAGLKLGSVTTGIAAAGVTGSVIGYQGGKALKKKHHFEMKELEKRTDDEDEIDTFEIIENDRT